MPLFRRKKRAPAAAPAGPDPGPAAQSEPALSDRGVTSDDSARPPAPPAPEPEVTAGETASGDAAANIAPAPAPVERRGLLGRLRGALRRTGSGLVQGVTDLFAGGRTLDAASLDELETLLLSADVGVEATDRILAGLTSTLKRRQLSDPEALIAALKQAMLEILEPVEVPLAIPPDRSAPFVVLVVGVNGTGKTTTIGKLAQRLQAEGHRVVLAAGDTFRAAAIEQLQVWGERHRVPVVAQGPGADSASVAYDALESATARGHDILIVDTAGRLHTQSGLMRELAKVHRVIAKRDPQAPHEVLLVLDAGTGQNALAQAAQFKEAVNVSGIVLTKLDGTAKGGVIFSIAARLAIPIRFIGVGEGADDLRVFRAREFVDALFAARAE